MQSVCARCMYAECMYRVHVQRASACKKLPPLSPFGPVWLHLALFCPVLSNLPCFAPFCPISPRFAPLGRFSIQIFKVPIRRGEGIKVKVQLDTEDQDLFYFSLKQFFIFTEKVRHQIPICFYPFLLLFVVVYDVL